MRKYRITGMSCAACSARVQNAVGSLKNVDECAVNLLTAEMTVEGAASDEEIIAAVINAGYGAAVKGDHGDEKIGDAADKEVKALIKRLIISAAILIPLMYVSMGHMIGIPQPSFISENHMISGAIQLVLSLAVMIVNRRFFISGTRGLLHGAPNMDTLVALGSFASFGYSVWMLVSMTIAHFAGYEADAYTHEFYFEGAAMILTLITVGKTLEAYSKGRTTNALKALTELAPDTANLIKDGVEIKIPAKELKKDDIFAVYPGEKFPADGIVLEGHATVDESSLTGESVPADKPEGARVSGATINKSGFVKCRATAVGEDTALAGIIRAVSDAASSKAPTAKAADKVSAVFVPAVMGIALITFVIWLVSGQTVGYALARGISVLVISCPCALGLATPVAVMVGSGVGAKHNILFKTAASLEETGKVKTVVFDKTGTLTHGTPTVTDVFAEDGDGDGLVRLAASLESKSEHPFALAIIGHAKEKNAELFECTDFENVPGKGLQGKIGGKTVSGGNAAYTETFCRLNEDIKKRAESLADEGKTPLYFTYDGKFAGMIAAADTPKPDAKKAAEELKKAGIDVIMLSGDNERTARAIGKSIGIDKVIAGVLPVEKESVIKKLSEKSKTAMVGDGINDAPALTAADIGIAIGAGTDIAIDSADVVLMKNSPADVAVAIRLSKKTLLNIYENLFWAFLYNVIGIPIAAGVFAGVGLTLNPMLASAAMSVSSFCVVMNALRLNLFKADNTKNKNKENDKMKKTLKIKGMMCPHCEARVKTALQSLEGVKAADVSHKKGTAEVVFDAEIPDEKLIAAVKEAGYEVLQIK